MRPVAQRLEEIKKIDARWWEDGKGYPAEFVTLPPHDGLDWLASVWARNYPADAPVPHVTLYPDGSLTLEWWLGKFLPALDVDLEKREILWCGLDMTVKPAADFPQRKIESPEDWGWAVGQVKAMKALVDAASRVASELRETQP